MTRYYETLMPLLAVLIAAAAVLLSGCSAKDQAAAQSTGEGSAPWISGTVESYPLVEGLHVTGTPVDIDAASYRLKISGAVGNPLSLSLEQIMSMEAEREFLTLVCPGFFTDEGNWTGVPIADLLVLAEFSPEAEQIKFVAADGRYSATLPIAEAKGEGMLIAYAFEDKTLPEVHGYPLRVVARNQPGNRWVKWLGEIVVQ